MMKRCLTWFALLWVVESVALADGPNWNDVEYVRKHMKMWMRKIHDSAHSFSEAEHVDTRGNVSFHVLPPSSKLTPAKPCCQQPNKLCDGKTGFDGPGWKELTMVVSDDPDPTRYQFEFSAKGADKNQQFTVRAVGDPLCDGHPETWEMTVKAGADGNLPQFDAKLIRKAK
jgi:hypothetical protein